MDVAAVSPQSGLIGGGDAAATARASSQNHLQSALRGYGFGVASGSIRVPACGVRRLAEQSFPAGRRKLHAGTRALPKRFSAANISETSYENRSSTQWQSQPVSPQSPSARSRRTISKVICWRASCSRARPINSTALASGSCRVRN
jgi:hypothetical protein